MRVGVMLAGPEDGVGVPGVNVKKTSLVGNSLSHKNFFFPLKTLTCVCLSELLFGNK